MSNGGGDATGSPQRHTRLSSKEESGETGWAAVDGEAGGTDAAKVEDGPGAGEASAWAEEGLDPLYRPPHSDGTAPPWPTDEAVEKLREVRREGSFDPFILRSFGPLLFLFERGREREGPLGAPGGGILIAGFCEGGGRDPLLLRARLRFRVGLN